MVEDNIREVVLKARQGAVSKAGSDWEKYVEDFIQKSLSEIRKIKPELAEIIDDICITRMGKTREIERLRDQYPKLYESIFIPIVKFSRNRQTLLKQPELIHQVFETGVIGDTDIVVFSCKHQIPVAVISCKVSLHGRLTETLFYSLYYRITNKIRFILATPDKGKQVEESSWCSEWGTLKQPSKDRLLASAFLDGVYVDNVSSFMPKGFNPAKDKTHLGGVIRPLSELPEDLIRWYQDIKFTIENGGK